MYFSQLNDSLFDISYQTLSFDVAEINRDVDVVKIKYIHMQITHPMKWQDLYINQKNLYIIRLLAAINTAIPAKKLT